MRLSFIYELSPLSIHPPIMEAGYGRVLSFDYDTWKVDPTPKVLQLGLWMHPSTGNPLVAGVNINYLTDEQIQRLRYYLPEILRTRNLKMRYWEGMRLLPDIFTNFYRTYNRDNINVVSPSTLRYLQPKELEKGGEADRATKLTRRREQLSALKTKKSMRRLPLEKPPVPKPPKPPEPPEPEEESPEELAKSAVDTQRGQQLISKIDDRIAKELRSTEPEEPEAPEVPEVPPEPAPEELEAEPEADIGSGPQPNAPDEDPEAEAGAPIPSKKKPK